MFGVRFGFVVLGFLMTVCWVLGEQCDTPPDLWCDDPSLAAQCGASQACAAYNASTYGRRVKLTLLYETLCPDCQEFMRHTMNRMVWRYGRGFVNLELVPSGNARRVIVNGTEQVVCQHGPRECDVNKLHSCAIDRLQDVNKWFPFVICMEEELANNTDTDTAEETCFDRSGLEDYEIRKVKDCHKGPLGIKLQLKMAKVTENVLPEKHTFVPWILINDVSTAHLQNYQASLITALCSWYRGADKPRGCKTLHDTLNSKQCAATR